MKIAFITPKFRNNSIKNIFSFNKSFYCRIYNQSYIKLCPIVFSIYSMVQ